MGKTAAILAVLLLGLVTITGLIVMGSMEQARLLEEKTGQVDTLLTEAEEQAQRLKQIREQAQQLDASLYESRQTVQQLTAENEALTGQNRQLTLDLQSARSSLHLLTESRDEALAKLAEANAQNETWETAYAHLQEEAAQDALLYEQALAEAEHDPPIIVKSGPKTAYQNTALPQ